MKTISDIKLMLDVQIKHLKFIEQNIHAGECHWRECKARIEILQWVLDIDN